MEEARGEGEGGTDGQPQNTKQRNPDNKQTNRQLISCSSTNYYIVSIIKYYFTTQRKQAELVVTIMMKLPSLIRSATNIAKQPIQNFFNLKPVASLSSSYSTLLRQQTVNVNVDVDVNVDVKQRDKIRKKDEMQAALLQQIISEQKKMNEIITTIQALQVNVDKSRAKTEEVQTPNVITMPDAEGTLQALNRSARNPKRANRGKRPVCRTARRAKKRRWGNHRR